MKSLQVSAALTITGILIVGIGVSYAQSNLALVSGVVSDPKGAVIPAAAVSDTNTATSVDTKTATDAAGFYVIRNLPIGAYTVTIEHPGFRRYVRQEIILTRRTPVTDALRELLDQEYSGSETRFKGMNNARVLALVMYEQAIAGSLPAAKEVAGRCEGKVPQRQELSGPDGGAVPWLPHTREENEERLRFLLSKAGLQN